MSQQGIVGRRKRAVARLWMRPGNGKVTINSRSFSSYFPYQLQRESIIAPLTATKTNKQFDLFIRTHGGGQQGQASAIRLAIARALASQQAQLRPLLKARGYLLCDARKKERKKYGLAGARKSFQYSKR